MTGARPEEYYDEYWSGDAPPPLDDPLRGERARLLKPRLERSGARTVLDAGCGAGALVAELTEGGLTATGLDVSGRAIEAAARAHPECRFVRHSLEEVPWPVDRGSFDVVVSFEVIEHLLRPRRLLEGAHEALRPGGHLALTTPYHGLLKNLAVTVLAFDRHFAVEGDHVRFFSDAALRRLLAETGFEVVSLAHFGRFFGLWAGVFVWAQRL